MTSAMVPLSTTAQRVTTLECAPCALRQAMRLRGQVDWTPLLADFAVDIVTGALTLADATEVLVPSSLVHYIEKQRGGGSSCPWLEWDAALQEHKLVTWITAQDAARLLCSPCGARYNNLCVPVPAGPLISQMEFKTPVDVFYSSKLPTLLDAVSACQRRGSGNRHHDRVRWRAWMRSALTCAYEGTHVPPIRVSDYASQLLRQDGGCEAVVWEAATEGLTPRWLETAAKTALAVGISPSSLSLSLPEEASYTARLLDKSVEVGITSWTTCALASTALYAHAAPRCAPQTLHVFTTGWNELSAALAPATREPAVVGEAEALLARCVDFVDAAQERLNTLLPSAEEPA